MVFGLTFLALTQWARLDAAKPVVTESEEDRVARYLRYSRGLARLTAEKVDIEYAMRTMCMDPRSRYGPHFKPGIHLYVSHSAVAARRDGAKPGPHPIGTLFVKEKFDAKSDSKPSVITVMEKMTNTNSADDWSYTMIRLSDRSIVREGFKVSCVSCHSHYEATDFITSDTDQLLTHVATGDSGKKR